MSPNYPPSTGLGFHLQLGQGEDPGPVEVLLVALGRMADPAKRIPLGQG